MSRKKQTIVLLISIFALSFFYMRIMERFFTPEGAFYACEKGLSYGPSEEILLKHKTDKGQVAIIGRIGKNLSVVEVEKKMFFLWGLSGGTVGYREPNEGAEMLVGNLSSGLVFGQVYNEKITSVDIYLKNRTNKDSIFLGKADVNDGFFYKQAIDEKALLILSYDYWELDYEEIEALNNFEIMVYGKDIGGENLKLLRWYV